MNLTGPVGDGVNDADKDGGVDIVGSSSDAIMKAKQKLV